MISLENEPRRGIIYQPRAKPWEKSNPHRALKGRHILRRKGWFLAQSLSKILLHVVFSTKNRENWIPQDIHQDLHAYLAGASRGQGSEAFRVGGTENHVHIACTLPRTLTVSKLLEEIKKTSSAWMKKQDTRCQEFAWQAGYGAFSLGQSQLDALIQYIDNQQAHHKTKPFKEELIELLQKYAIEYDERYLWD